MTIFHHYMANTFEDRRGPTGGVPEPPPAVATLMSRWNFAESTGLVAADSQGLSNGTYVSPELGVASIVSGVAQTSVGFNGTSSNMTAPHVTAWQVSSWSALIYMQLDNLPAVGQPFGLMDMDDGLPPGGWSLEVFNDNGTGRIRAYIRNSTGGVGSAIFIGPSTGVGTIAINTAYRVALTFDGTDAAIWIDGGVAAVTSGVTPHGMQNNDSKVAVGAYDGNAAFLDGVLKRASLYNGALTQTDLQALPAAVTITHGGGGEPPPVTGTITIPQFAYQQLSDTVPANAVWWNPTSGNDANDGSTKAEAKKTFGAAEGLANTSRRIILAGGAADSTTYHVVPKITPTKSGTGSGARMELFGEPGRKVVLVREGDFLGGIDGSWNWTQVSSSLNTWDSPNLGISDGATTNSGGSGSNWIAGILRIPGGCNGRPHLMKLPWVDTSDMNNTGGGNPNEGGYAGPSICSLGNGRIRIRLQPPTQAVAGNKWPTGGMMGSLIKSDGTWAQPSLTPNDYEIHMVRWDGDFGNNGAKDLFNFATNNVDWWHIKGINGALINTVARIGANTGIKFEHCTFYPHWCGWNRVSTSNSSVEVIRCRILTGDNRHMSWRAHKTTGYWYQHFRAANLYDGSGDRGAGSTFLLSHSTLFGWFDEGLPQPASGTITIDHCAVLNNVDDAYQVNPNNSLQIIRTYCYVFGGPFRSTDNDNSDGSNVHWIEHHNIYYQPGIPVLWQPYGSNQGGAAQGAGPAPMYSTHSENGKARKCMYNTFICCADAAKVNSYSNVMSTMPGGTNVPAGAAHECFNNLVCTIAVRRFPDHATPGDSVSARVSCQASSAGIHRYDYNLYFRQLPGSAVQPFFWEWQNSRGSGRESFTSLADFRASGKKTTSESMYSDGTDGHEHHGVQQDPQFRDLANRDFRPQSAGATSGAKNVTGIIGGSFENWKGALNPAGDGNEVGPQNPDPA
jgi:hypothetical protein